jgi:hypothetical protein
MPEPIVMKTGMSIMPPEPIFHKSLTISNTNITLFQIVDVMPWNLVRICVMPSEAI